MSKSLFLVRVLDTKCNSYVAIKKYSTVHNIHLLLTIKKKKMIVSLCFLVADEIFEHIVTRKGTLSIKIRHYQDEKVCSLTIITNMTTTEYTSKEEQDGNIIVERRDTFCIFHFKNFTLESYVNTTVYADADLRRILHPDLFLNRLNDRIAGMFCIMFFIDTVFVSLVVAIINNIQHVGCISFPSSMFNKAPSVFKM